jgi:golgi phosphoprotein 3
LLTFAEEILLLFLDDETGKFENMYYEEFKYALAGAVLMDLALRSKIDTDLEKLTIVDPTPTGEEILDKFLSIISESEVEKSTFYWVSEIAKSGAEIRDKALDSLVKRGILRVEEKKVLWVIGVRRYPTVDDTQEKEVRRRLTGLLNSDDIPSPHDVVLVSLADTFELFPQIVGKYEAKKLAPRIKQISKLDLIGQSVSQVLKRLREIKADAYVLHPY